MNLVRSVKFHYPTLVILNDSINLSIKPFVNAYQDKYYFTRVSFLKDSATELESWTYPDVEWKDCLVVSLPLWVSWTGYHNAGHYTGTNLDACLNKKTCLNFCLDSVNVKSAQIVKTEGLLFTTGQRGPWMYGSSRQIGSQMIPSLYIRILIIFKHIYHP